MIIILSGVSGTGKTTFANFLVSKHGFVRSISYTTRKQREEESEGDYHFISKSEFEEKIVQNFFIEYTNQFGNYYGTAFSVIENFVKEGKNVVLCLDKNGYIAASKKWPLIGIYLLPPEKEELIKRLNLRQDGQTEIRMNDIYEIAKNDAPFYEYNLQAQELIKMQQKLEEIIFEKK